MPPPAEERCESLRRMRRALEEAEAVVLTTHVNADGDGAGSELAMLDFLRFRGIETAIVNPTPFPNAFRFLLDDEDCWTPSDQEGREALERADLLLVLDTSERSRLGEVASHLDELRVAVIDHHPTTPDSLGGLVLRDPGACATGELVYDLLTLEGEELTLEQARALYAAIVTDTGSFRYGNTSSRAHAIAAELLGTGVDVERMFRLLYGRYTRSGLELLRRALGTLEEDPDHPIAWLTVAQRDLDATGATAEDREGLVEYARRLQGVEVALLFRELPRGRSKVSLRSNGTVDVAAVARDFGGGGHVQAAGLLLDRPVEEARELVLDRLRTAVRESLHG